MKRIGILIASMLAFAALPAAPALAACHSASFSPSEYQVKENEGKVTLGVQNPGPVAEDRTVDWETVNGTAKAGTDYVADSGTLSFSPTDTSEVIEVTITNNAVNESNEVFTVRLKARPGSCITQDSIGPPATVTITDDDPKPQPKPSPTPSRTQASSPAPTPTPKRTTPSPSPSRSASPSPSPTPSASPSPTQTAIAAPDSGSDGGLSGGALAGIIAGVIVVGGGGALLVRRRFLT